MLKNPIKIVIICLLIFLVGDKCFSQFGIFLTRFSSDPYAQLYNKKLQSDVLILGNSRAYRHLFEDDWTKILNSKVSNISLPGIPLIHSEVILDDYVRIYGFPRNIIIELDCLISSKKIIPSFKFLMFFSEKYSVLIRKYFINTYIFSNLINLYKLNTTHYLNIIYKILKKYEQPKLYEKVTQKQLNDFTKSEKNERFKSNEYNMKSLKRILKKYDDKSKIVFMISPFHPLVLKKYKKEIRIWKENIKKIIPKENLIFDYSGSISKDYFFNDPFHLNNLGVNKLKNELLLTNFFERL